jgi:predicted site-specific integrase-resolvase
MQAHAFDFTHAITPGYETTRDQLEYSLALVSRWGFQRLSSVIRNDHRPGEEPKPSAPHRAAIYTRVSSAHHRENLERQAERLPQYGATRGYQVVKEIASGVNASRPKLLSLLRDSASTLLVVEHKDRLTRFGFRSLEALLEL